MWSPETLKVLNENFEAKQAAEEAEGEVEFEESENEIRKDSRVAPKRPVELWAKRSGSGWDM